MPQIYYLNPPPNPFWDFVSGLEDHPFFRAPPHHRARGRFARYGPPSPPTQPAAATPSQAASEPAKTEMSEKARGKQAYVEDPPEVDPSTVKPEVKKSEDSKDEKAFPFRGRGRFARAFEGDGARECRRGREGREGHPCRGGPRSRHGPPPFPFGRPPWAFHGPPMSAGQPDFPHNHEHHHHHGPPGMPPHPEHHRGPRGPHGPHAPHRRPSPPHDDHRGPPSSERFDLGGFLNNLGGKLGIDLSGAAEGLGLERPTTGRINTDVDFEPRADIFENKDRYTIHLSRPGAKKEDVGVDYDGEHSVIRVTGVVHRPDVDEKMLNELVVDGRKRETGVFEKAIRLGTKREPANIDVGGISAKMTDGVLIVRIPKVEKVHQKREVPISAEPSSADYDDDYSDKPVLFDAEEQASVAGTDVPSVKREEISLIDMKDNEEKHETKETREEAAPAEAANTGKALEAEQEKEKVVAQEAPEQLPAYSAEHEHGHGHEEEDWEHFSDASGEGEYIKIDVK